MDRLNDGQFDHEIFFEKFGKNYLDEWITMDEGLPYLIR